MHIYGHMIVSWMSSSIEVGIKNVPILIKSLNSQIFTSKDETAEGSEKSKGSEAKELLARYGGAYLATSISLSAISFGLCYVLVNSGVDVASLLQKVTNPFLSFLIFHHFVCYRNFMSVCSLHFKKDLTKPQNSLGFPLQI